MRIIPETMKRYICILFIILSMASTNTLNARQKEGIAKVLRKVYPAGPSTKMNIRNSFGDISCKLWDKDTISVEVTISVASRSEQEAEKIFSRIEISFSGSEGQIDIITKIAEHLQSNDHFSIDYLVWMPPSVMLDLANKFGDVMVDELQAKSVIRVEYGKALLGKLTHGDNLLEISFGTVSISSAKGAVVSLRFSKMRAEYAGSLKINSKYSDIHAGEVIVFDGVFEGGTVNVKRTSVVSVTSRYSSFKLEQVSQKIDLNTELGNFEVTEILSGFSSLVVDCSHGNVTCPLPEGLSYSLEAESHFGSLRFPRERAEFSLFSESGQETLYKGTIGSNPTATVRIRNEFGSIRL